MAENDFTPDTRRHSETACRNLREKIELLSTVADRRAVCAFARAGAGSWKFKV